MPLLLLSGPAIDFAPSMNVDFGIVDCGEAAHTFRKSTSTRAESISVFSFSVSAYPKSFESSHVFCSAPCMPAIATSPPFPWSSSA